jgi:uncharacterized membrane protein (UPF0127 family)
MKIFCRASLALLVALSFAGCDHGIVTPTGEGANQGSSAGGGGKPSDKRLYPLATLRTAVIEVDDRQVPVWVMDTQGKRTEGMMWLQADEVPDGHGMLFAFPEPAPLSFWMRNTLIALDIAYISADGRLLNIQRGEPLDPTGLPSDGPAQYVLEMKAGEMKSLGITPGATVKIPEDIVGR